MFAIYEKETKGGPRAMSTFVKATLAKYTYAVLVVVHSSI